MNYNGGAAPIPLPEGYYPSGLPLLLTAPPFWDTASSNGFPKGQRPICGV